MNALLITDKEYCIQQYWFYFRANIVASYALFLFSAFQMNFAFSLLNLALTSLIYFVIYKAIRGAIMGNIPCQHIILYIALWISGILYMPLFFCDLGISASSGLLDILFFSLCAYFLSIFNQPRFKNGLKEINYESSNNSANTNNASLKNDRFLTDYSTTLFEKTYTLDMICRVTIIALIVLFFTCFLLIGPGFLLTKICHSFLLAIFLNTSMLVYALNFGKNGR